MESMMYLFCVAYIIDVLCNYHICPSIYAKSISNPYDDDGIFQIVLGSEDMTT